MSQNPEVKLAHNTELAFTEAHLTDLKPETVYSANFCVLPGDCRATRHGSFLSRVSILTRDIDSCIGILSVRPSFCPSVRNVSVGILDENGLTYCHSFFFTIR